MPVRDGCLSLWHKTRHVAPVFAEQGMARIWLEARPLDAPPEGSSICIYTCMYTYTCRERLPDGFLYHHPLLALSSL